MSLILSKMNQRSNNLIYLTNSNSNKTFFLKKSISRKINESNIQKEIPEKSFIPLIYII